MKNQLNIDKKMLIFYIQILIYPQKTVIVNHSLKLIENEMIALCNDIIQLIDNYFLIHTNDLEEQVFKLIQSLLLLLLGDYHRYLCEILEGNMKLMS